jgi:uncharacterized protein
MTGSLPPAFILRAFEDLRRRQLGLGVDDLLALRSAVRAGFGLGSDRALVELCVTLWAKSPGEADSVRAVFARYDPPAWDETGPLHPEGLPSRRLDGPTGGAPVPVLPMQPVRAPITPTGRIGDLPPLPALGTTGRQIVFDPQFPITRRAIGQAFRRLLRPEPFGPPVQLDIEATIERRSRSGVAGPVVLVPRRRNTARLLLLVDCGGSMVPFHPLADHLREAIVENGGLRHVTVAYFHDTPLDEPEPRLVRRLSRLSPQLDPVLDAVRGSLDGLLFSDPLLAEPVELTDLVEQSGAGTGVIVVSDAGAARGGVDPARNLSCVGFARALREDGRPLVWLNPMPARCWRGTSAGELARHVAMLPLDLAGLHRAVDVLRGRPITIERAA